MPKAKTVRFKIPKAKLLKFNRKGKSIPAPAPQRDLVAEENPIARFLYTDAQWAVVRPYFAASMGPNPDEELRALVRAERNGGTAS